MLNTIYKLEQRLKEAEKVAKVFADHILEVNNGDEPSVQEQWCFDEFNAYFKKYGEKEEK